MKEEKKIMKKENKIIKCELTIEEMQLILSMLAEAPLKVSMPTFMKLKKQAESQMASSEKKEKKD